MAVYSVCSSMDQAVVERFGPASGSGGIAVADDSVWITAHTTFSTWRLPR